MRGFLAFLGDGGDDMVMAEGSGRWWQAAADGPGGEGSLQDITQRGSRGEEEGGRRRRKKEKKMWEEEEGGGWKEAVGESVLKIWVHPILTFLIFLSLMLMSF